MLVHGFGHHHESRRNMVLTYKTFKRMNFYLWATICLHGKSLAISFAMISFMSDDNDFDQNDQNHSRQE